jgi:hypothetical protein
LVITCHLEIYPGVVGAFTIATSVAPTVRILSNSIAM